MAAAALVFAGCKEEPEQKDPPVVTEDSISVTPEDKSFTNTGGEAAVVVTSSGAWTLSGGQAWATPSATSGDSGDAVLFTVSPNTTENKLEAIFTFKCGEAEDTFKIEVEGMIITKTKLDLVSDAEVELPRAKSSVEVKIDTEVAYRDLQQSITILSGGEGWIEYKTRTQGTDGIVSLFFDLTANTSFENREAEIEITGGDDGAATVKVIQAQTDRLVVEENRLILEQEGGTAVVKLTTNVEYEVAIDEDAKAWLTAGTPTTDDEGVISLPFTAAALGEGERSRSGVITITQKDGTLELTVNISQAGATLINTAANMNKNWAWAPTWANNAPLTNLTNYTFEALVNANTFTKTIATHGSASKLSTIGGIEGGKFMVRFGDEGIETNQLQVIYSIGTGNDGLKKTGSMSFNTGEWYHIAVTVQTGNTPRFGKVYVNGVEQTDLAASGNAISASRAVNFGQAINGDELGWGQPRRFWIGYAWDGDRFFDGLISEVRIWNRALTEAEINAENHFYSVPADSPNLVGYWKFNDNLEGTSGIIKDSTSNGNHFTTAKEVTWTPVALP